MPAPQQFAQPVPTAPQPAATQPQMIAPQPVSPQAQPVAPQQPGGVDGSYDFIVNPLKPARKSLSLLPSGGSTLRRAGIVGAGLAILLIIVIIFASLLGGGSGGSTAALTTVAQEQTELARVATLGTAHASDQTTQNLAYNVSASLTSANGQLLTYLATNHHKLSTKALALRHSAQTDRSLAAALTDSTFDSTFTDIIQSDLNSYMQALQVAYKANPGPKGRALLNSQYQGAQLLLEQSKQQ